MQPTSNTRVVLSRFAFVCLVVFAVSLGFVGGAAVDARELPSRIKKLLSTSETVVGETITYPVTAPAKLSAAIVTLAPSEETGWHRHGVPVFGYILEGELTVDYGDKGTRNYRMGDGFAEAINAPHNGRNTGKSPMRVLAVFMGTEGQPTSIPVTR